MGMSAGGMGPDPIAISRLNAPALTMMILTGIGMAWGLVSIVTNILGVAIAPTGGDQFAQYMSGGIGIVVAIFGIACGGFSLYGLNQMRQARSWGLSLAVVIMSMVPCLGPCWCINLFVGIWALVVLNDAPVKSAFQG